MLLFYRLIKRLLFLKPRRSNIIHTNSSLKAKQQLKKTSNQNSLYWRSIGSDPQFLIKNNLPKSGWNLLEISIEHDQKQVTCSFYYNTGHGFNEEQSINFTLNSNIISPRLFYLPKKVKSIRFDPMETDGLFSLKQFEITWISYELEPNHLIKELSKDSSQTKFINKEILATIEKAAHRANKPLNEIAQNLYCGNLYWKTKKRITYQNWINKREIPFLPSEESLGALLKNQKELPLISIILPVHNTPINLLCECIDSVVNQTYPNWQLCIADDGSSDPKIKNCLLKYQKKNSRINIILRQENGHIVAASNSALELAKGDYIAFLDHDDTLAIHSLHKVAEAIYQSREKPLLIYSDEDKISRNGKRFQPHFKPKWNPDLLLSQNYICHLTVIDSNLVKKVGGLRKGTEGSQDHDLLIRCIPYLNHDNVVHISEILYHWRAIKGSTASGHDQKHYTTNAGLKSIQDHLNQRHNGAFVEQGFLPNTYRVRWPIPKPEPLVSLIIPTRNGYDILKPCVDAILARTNYQNFELLILDNQSTCLKTLMYMQRISSDPRVTIHHWDYPFNYSSINNFGVTKAKGDIIGLVNNDIEPINSDWMDEMISQACRPEIGCVGAKLYYSNDTIQHAGVIIGIGGIAGHSHKYSKRDASGYFSRLKLIQNLSAVTGACLFMRKSVFEEVGGLEEIGLPVAFNDVDLCLKVCEAGYRNLWTPYAELYHHESVSRGSDNTKEKKERARQEVNYMKQRWQSKLNEVDPAYNPNLTQKHEDFSLC